MDIINLVSPTKLATYHNKIKAFLGGKVDKENGKGLSTNDFTDQLKAKLDGLEEGGGTLDPTGLVTQEDFETAVTALETAIAGLGSALTWKGSVTTEAELPAEKVAVGDMYTITESGAEKAWNGTEWYELGRIFDTSAFLTAENFVEITDAEIDAMFATE